MNENKGENQEAREESKGTKEESKIAREESIRKIASQYYLRRDIQKYLLLMSKNREVVPKYFENFGRRPDTLEYANDIAALAKKGVTSFHCSEELWSNPMDLSTELRQEQLNNLRIGWDLIIDIDSKYLDYSKIAAELIIDALKFHNIKNLGLKYSGNKGFHIGISWGAFPEKIYGIEIKNFFPDGPRIIALYLKEIIGQKLKEKIAGLTFKQQGSIKIIDEEGAKAVAPDIILVSSRHLFRMPYSLHEKTGLASIVIKPEQLKDFQPGWAKPSRAIPKIFLPKPEKEEANQLVMQAFDWDARKKSRIMEKPGDEKTKPKARIILIKDTTPILYPPCITNILNGMRDDGRKRALFILINFFRSINLGEEEIRKKIDEWNSKNYTPLKEGYIISQLSWFKKQKTMLPPNCDKPYYKDIGICMPDFICGKIKNPINYVVRKSRIMRQETETETQNEQQFGKGKRRRKRNKVEE